MLAYLSSTRIRINSNVHIACLVMSEAKCKAICPIQTASKVVAVRSEIKDNYKYALLVSDGHHWYLFSSLTSNN